MPADPGEVLRALFAGALAEVAPGGPTARALVDLGLDRGAAPVVLLALGKAGAAMAAGAATVVGDRVVERVVVVPDGAAAPSAPWVWRAAHPVPDARSEEAGRALLAAAARATPDHEVIALVSGGGSALAAVPAAGLTLADKAAVAARLAAAGAPIGELNRVRRQLSAIKGGRLAAASRAPVTTLVISDVPGDQLADVASGPTVPDPTGPAEAAAVIARWLDVAALPERVRRHLDDARRADRPGGRRPAAGDRDGDRAVLLLGRRALAVAVEARAAARGLAVEAIAPDLDEGVEAAAARLIGRVAAVRASGPAADLLLVAAGEPTVRLPSSRPPGGRAHQLALLLARGLRGDPGVTALCAGSDGADGDSGAAGAVVDGATWDRVAGRGRDPQADLAALDAAAALAAVGARVVTGPTGVNHADLVLVLVRAGGIDRSPGSRASATA